jgi:hypothetical protein
MRQLRWTRLVALVTLVAITALAPEGASASSIGVYFAPDASDCDAIVAAPFQPLNWYVLAVLNGSDPVASGITGGALRVTGAPVSWFHVVNRGPSIPEPPSGDLLQQGVEFGLTCQTGTNGVVVLFSVQSLPTSVINNVVLAVAAPQMPQYAGYDSPVLFGCDASSTHVCVPGTSGFINGPPCYFPDVTVAGGGCPPVAVAPNTWGAVKTLYGE